MLFRSDHVDADLLTKPLERTIMGMRKLSTTISKTSGKNWIWNLLKQSGAWVIRLPVEIRKHLSVKLFLQLFCILSLTSVAIVGVVQHYLPLRYIEKISADLSTETDKLIMTLEGVPESEIEDYIMAFCLENGTEAQLYDDKQNDIYCVDLSKSLLIKDATIGQVISWDFMNSNKLYRLDISISHTGGADIVNTIKSLYPLIDRKSVV